MYVPAAFRVADLPTLHDFIEQHSFATLISTGANGLIASHVPILLRRDEGDLGCLYGHVAKANEHWQSLGTETLVIFSGPHAYISPTWYAEPNTVPTWNYLAVHAYGVSERIDDSAGLEQILADTVTKYERSQPQPWVFDAATEFHQKLASAVVGFRMPITRFDGKWKLNQNHPAERRRRVIDALRNQHSGDARILSDLMQAGLADD